jgi:hypothetical protein
METPLSNTGQSGSVAKSDRVGSLIRKGGHPEDFKRAEIDCMGQCLEQKSSIRTDLDLVLMKASAVEAAFAKNFN